MWEPETDSLQFTITKEPHQPNRRTKPARFFAHHELGAQTLMKPARLATHASALFMVFAWLLITALLTLHFTVGVFTNTTVARVLLVAFILAWVLIPVQVVRYYRRN